MTDDMRMIEAARRKARRMARGTPGHTFQQALDAIARGLGRRHWKAFLADPVQVPRDDEPISNRIQYDVPFGDPDFLRQERVAIFGLTANALYLASHGDHDLVRTRLGQEYPDVRIEFLETEPHMIDRYLAGVALVD